MKIGFGRKGHRGLYVYWPNGMECERWDWLFHTILRRSIVCYGQYENGYRLI